MRWTTTFSSVKLRENEDNPENVDAGDSNVAVSESNEAKLLIYLSCHSCLVIDNVKIERYIIVLT